MELHETIKPPTGRLILDIFEDGVLIERYDGPNLVVSGMANVMAALLGGESMPVTQIGFGTNGTAPVTGNSTLSSAFVKDVSSVSYPSPGLVKFNFSLENSEANGLAIMEFGLLTSTDVLVARRVRSSPINKNVALRFAGAWLIQF